MNRLTVRGVTVLACVLVTMFGAPAAATAGPLPSVTAASTVTTTARPTPAARARAARAAKARAAQAARASRSAARTAVPQSVAGNAVLEVAARYVGTSYVYGGSTPAGFDCSGFVKYVYAQLGVSLPRTATAIKAAGTVISRADAQPGDLIWSPGHIAIYAGGNDQIDAPRPGKTIQFRSIWQSAPVFIRIG
jgi:cell wall-associated NlpC family hydrolase